MVAGSLELDVAGRRQFRGKRGELARCLPPRTGFQAPRTRGIEIRPTREKVVAASLHGKLDPSILSLVRLHEVMLE